MNNNILVELIENSEVYNGHCQLTVQSLTFETVLEVYRVLEQEYFEVAMQFMYNGEHFGTWGVTFYQIGYWTDQPHPLNHKDRILFSVENVKGFPK